MNPFGSKSKAIASISSATCFNTSWQRRFAQRRAARLVDGVEPPDDPEPNPELEPEPNPEEGLDGELDPNPELGEEPVPGEPNPEPEPNPELEPPPKRAAFAFSCSMRGS